MENTSITIDDSSGPSSGAQAYGLAVLRLAVQQDMDSWIHSIIIEEGIDINVCFEDGKTALHLAAVCGVRNMTLKLITCGARVNEQDNYGKTPLHYAVKADIAEVLMNFGAVLDVKDHDGNTPLHEALFNKREVVMESLLSRGARMNITNLEGEQIFDILRSCPTKACDKIKEHIIKMKIAKLDRDLCLPEGMDSVVYSLAKYHDICKEELIKMKNLKFGHVSLISIINQQKDPLFVSCTELLEFAESPRFRSDFPIYYLVAIEKLKHAKGRKYLLDQCARSFYINHPTAKVEMHLPQEVKRLILSNLQNCDLTSTLLAMEPKK